MLAKENGVFFALPPILFTLMEKGTCTQKELAQYVHIRPASLTETLQRMEKGSLIERKTDEKDQRIQRVSITPEGEEKLKQAFKVEKIMENECFMDFSKDEKETFIRLLNKMNNSLEKLNLKGGSK